jgi:hypothetical protein
MTSITSPAPFRPAARNTAPRLRLTRRGRDVLLTLAAAPLVVAAFWFALNGGGATATLEHTTGYSTVTVQPGDTLWSIAESIAPSADPRDVIVELMQFNALSSADVPAGFELAIPPNY